MEIKDIGEILVKKGLLSAAGLEFTPLQGGVSSDIYLVKDQSKKLVVKKALSKLRVKDIWEADTNRNKSEQDYIRYVKKIIPRQVPEIVYSDDEQGFFVMEFLDSSFVNWKTALIKGEFDLDTTKEAAILLARVHTHSWGDPQALQTFDNTGNFQSLRIDPYLLTTGDRNPKLRALFRTEAARLIGHREALVHGDFSPKNIMLGPERLVLLDHEVAWFGDPAFDIAFMLTHLHLKQLLNYGAFGQRPDLSTLFWETYYSHLKPAGGDIKVRTCRLWLMILLARVDGKSPVEYLEGREKRKELIRSFVYDSLLEGDFERESLHEKWNHKLKKTLSK